MINEEHIRELLRVKGSHLYHRESQELEYKEQFNFAGLADYYRDFAAFANNRGGYLIHGVKDSPRKPIGLSESSLEQFNKIDPETISGHLLEIFSSNIKWEQATVELNGLIFGVFLVHESMAKPIIAKKDEGKDQILKSGEIYYRYGGRTQKIQYAELENIIDHRVEQNNRQWLDLMSKIGRAGPHNAAVLDTEKGLVEKGKSNVLIVDESLTDKLKFVKEGEFSEKQGAPTLKLLGDVIPVGDIEVKEKVKEHLTKLYPLSATELASEVQKAMPSAKRNDIWQVIKDNDLKNNISHSAYNFRNKKQEDEYKNNGEVPSVTPSIYNRKAVDFIVKVLRAKN